MSTNLQSLLLDTFYSNSLLQGASRFLHVDKPIMSYRLVGNRLELYLYGGQMVACLVSIDRIGNLEEYTFSFESVPPAGRVAMEALPVKPKLKPMSEINHPGLRDLESMKLIALHALATKMHITSVKRKTKAMLIEEIRNARVGF